MFGFQVRNWRVVTWTVVRLSFVEKELASDSLAFSLARVHEDMFNTDLPCCAGGNLFESACIRHAH